MTTITDADFDLDDLDDYDPDAEAVADLVGRLLDAADRLELHGGNLPNHALATTARALAGRARDIAVALMSDDEDDDPEPGDGPPDPVVAALLAEAHRLDDLALTLPDFADAAETRARAARTRDQAVMLALSADDEDDASE